MISKEEVKKLAELSLLAIDDAELDKLTGEIDSILEYISDIDTLASEKGTEREKPALYNVMRDDVVTNEAGAYTEKILNEAPKTKDGYLQVKKIL